MARLKDFYQKTVIPKLTKDLGVKNAMQVPKITKITVNMGVGEAVADRKVMDAAVADLTKITGPEARCSACRRSRSRRSRLRENLAIGTQGDAARRTHVGVPRSSRSRSRFPRIRDFRGINPRSFDGRGNFSLGIKEQIIFPEIQYDQIDQLRGMDITITTTAKDNKQGHALLDAFNFPFRK